MTKSIFFQKEIIPSLICEKNEYAELIPSKKKLYLDGVGVSYSDAENSLADSESDEVDEEA